jgi:lysophospholipase L1-like esterase
MISTAIRSCNLFNSESLVVSEAVLEERQTTKKRKWIGLLLALVSACLTIFLLEIGVRLFLPPPYHGGGGVPPYHPQDTLYQCDNNMGWTGVPNFHDDVIHFDKRRKIKLNSLGMYDTEHPIEKPANNYRILMLGDSFVHATQVEEKQTSHQVLEDYFNEQFATSESGRIELLSAGVVGWGTTQQLAYYRQHGQQFKPDLVLLMFYLGNDFENNLPGSPMTLHGGINCYSPYFIMCNDQMNPEFLPFAPGISSLEPSCSSVKRTFIKLMGRLYQYSRLYQQLDPLVQLYLPQQTFGEEEHGPYLALYLPDDDPIKEQAWLRTEAAIAQLQKESHQNGSEFAVVVFSTEVLTRLSLLSPEERAAFTSENPILTQIEPDLPNKRLVNFFNQHNIPFIDTTQPIIEQERVSQLPLYLYGDGHWTAEGNRVMGEMIARWLNESNLVTVD